jgi:hypothetical protein
MTSIAVFDTRPIVRPGVPVDRPLMTPDGATR